MNKYLIAIPTIMTIITLLAIYLNTYYEAMPEVNNKLKSNNQINIIKDKNGYYFDGPGDENILVFYPGGKVEYTAYIPLMSSLSEKGIDSYIVKFPYNIAFFKPNAINEIKNNYKYKNWYIGGHSLGGVVASMDSKNNNIQGLILLAAYSTKKVNCKVLSIYGTNDGILNFNKYEKNRINIKNSKEVKIKGGNHSYFGYYGMQKGDKKASITRKKQQENTVQEIYNFINS